MEDKMAIANPLRLPIPYRSGQLSIFKAEYDTPELQAIADTSAAVDENVWKAMKIFIDGSVTALIAEDGTRIEDRQQIRAVTYDMPIQSASVLMVAIALTYNDDDYVEGLYECPRCHNVISAVEGKDGEDTRDRIRDLVITACNSIDERIKIKLENPVTIREKSAASGDENHIILEEFVMKHPTIKNAITSVGKHGAVDALRGQFAMFTEALESINGQELSGADRARYGMTLFERMKAGNDTRELTRQATQYGISGKVQKVCRCGKRFDVTIETKSFFAFALRQA